MTVKVSDNIFSPLGFTSEANYSEVKAGHSRIKTYEGKWGLPEPFAASLFEEGVVEEAFSKIAANVSEKYTPFEKMCIVSAKDAIERGGIDSSSDRVIFILSTTKGNVSLLDSSNNEFPLQRALLGKSAGYIAKFFKNNNTPVVVSNACISGLCAQITAMRFLESGDYDCAVVIGADVMSKFIISGFQSFKAFSSLPCKPFDKDRVGLNLGEAAATVVFVRKDENKINTSDWVAVRGAIRNDANHISGPSRTGEGSYRALKVALGDENPQNIAFINAHGTSTLYNDEMESIAIDRMGLADVPVNSLKGYYGHTMAAAGVLESIISSYAVDDGIILPTRGYETCGVSRPLSLSNKYRETDKKMFIKLLSGFGGCNAALLFKKGGEL